MLEILALCILTGIAAAVIASTKGRSGVGYFFIGFFLNLLGVLIAIGVSRVAPPKPGDSGWIVCHACPKTRPTDSDRCPHCGAGRLDPHAHERKCPACAEWVLKEARKCKHCGEALPA